MSETPRYTSLSDYLQVIRKQRVLIASVAVLFAAAALALSFAQTPEYTAEASLTFRDVEQDLNLLGEGVLPELAPDQRAAVNAELVTRRSVAERVKESLRTELPIEELQEAVSTQVGARTNLVFIRATAEEAEFAADLANEYSRQVQAIDTAEVRKRLETAIASLRSELGGPPGLQDSFTQGRISQLETVRRLAKPVEIAEPAEVPGSPSSPRTRRNFALGAIVGIAFGLLAAFLRDSLDRRFRASDEVRDEMQLPVIGRVASDALGEVSFLQNGDASPESEAALEAFRVLRNNLEFLQVGREMRSVLITSGLAEEGKSTVSVALAASSALAGRRTLLVECDLRRPSLASRLDLEPTPGLTDYLVGDATPRDILQVVNLSPSVVMNDGSEQTNTETIEGATVVCITAGSSSPLPAELLGSKRFEEFLEKVSKAYELVVLDTSPILSVVDALELVPQVDGLLVCVRLAKTTREEARAAVDALQRLPDTPTGVVVTGVRPGEDSYGYYYGTYGRDL